MSLTRVCVFPLCQVIRADSPISQESPTQVTHGGGRLHNQSEQSQPPSTPVQGPGHWWHLQVERWAWSRARGLQGWRVSRTMQVMQGSVRDPWGSQARALGGRSPEPLELTLGGGPTRVCIWMASLPSVQTRGFGRSRLLLRAFPIHGLASVLTWPRTQLLWLIATP